MANDDYTETDNIGLKKPDQGAKDYRDYWEDNLDVLDDNVPNVGALADRPASAGTEWLYVVTDDGSEALYVDTDSGWVEIGTGSGGSGGSPVETQSDGVTVVSGTDILDFGAGFTVTNPAGDETDIAFDPDGSPFYTASNLGDGVADDGGTLTADEHLRRKRDVAIPMGEIPDAEHSAVPFTVADGDTLKVGRWEVHDGSFGGSVSSDLTIDVYNETADQSAGSASTIHDTGTRDNPLATVNASGGDVQVTFRVVNETGDSIKAGGFVGVWVVS